MTPTLLGRIQTRLLLLFTVGLAWTIVVSIVLPRGGGSIAGVYGATFTALFVVAFIGVGWELFYHFLQQYRWEKDWPILIGLLQGIPEFITTLVAVNLLRQPDPPVISIFLHFFTTWVLVWIVANGPMRVLVLRWRYNGGRVL